MEKTTTAENGKIEPAKKTLPLFRIFKDGNNYEYKIANMDNPIICNRKGIVQIESIKKQNSKEPRFSISNVYDRETGIYFGVPLGINNRTKEIIWQRFVIGDARNYDLSNKQDAVEWTIVRRAPWLQGSSFQRGKAHYRMFDKEAEANEVITRMSIRKKAIETAEKMIAIEEQVDMLRNFGKNPLGFSPKMLYAEIIKIAEKSPKEFLDVWANANRPVITVFKRCLQLGMIRFDINKGGYLWKDSLAMGISEQSAIAFFLENKQILNQANIESKQRDVFTKKLSAEAGNKMTQLQLDEKDAEQSTQLTELQITAKYLGIEGYNTMDEQELNSAIESASVAG